MTDRKKELLITSGGKNIAPQHLEGKLKQIAAVSQAVAIGDRRPYVVALLTLDPARVAAEAEKAGSPARTPEEAARCPVFKAYVEKQVEEINKGLARYESIKKIALLPKELSVETGELTPDAQAEAPGHPRAPQGRDRRPLRLRAGRLPARWRAALTGEPAGA